MPELTPERARELLALAPHDELRVVTHRKMSSETVIECGVFEYVVPPRCAELFAASVDALRAYLAAVERAERAERERDALRALVKRYVEAHAARVAHSAREPHDEDWYALLAALNGAVADALAELRAAVAQGPSLGGS